jgi:mannose-6-phosphate isomerase-like protein (cupin superfamily)
MKKGEQIVNAVTGEVLTMLVSKADTSGKFQRYEVMLPARRESPPLHHHTMFTESFAVKQGSLDFYVGKERKLVRIAAGEQIDVAIGRLHTFANSSDEMCHMVVTTRPPGEILDAFKLAYGIANDGGAAADGLPRNRVLRMRFIQLSGGYLPSIPIQFQNIVFSVFKAISMLTGMEKRVDRYRRA